MFRRAVLWSLIGACAVAFGPASAQAPNRSIDQGLERVRQAAGETVRIERSGSTGAARLIVFEPGKLRFPNDTAKTDPAMRAGAFLQQWGGAFGVTDVGAQLRLRETRQDILGATHVRYEQIHRGVPVFGTMLRVHFTAAGQVRAANGSFVPGIELDPTVSVALETAIDTARGDVFGRNGRLALDTGGSRLLVYRTNLAYGVPGANHLVWEIELSGDGVHDFVYVDAHKGAVVDWMSAQHGALDRLIYDNGFEDPANVVWREGEATPFGDEDVDNLIEFTEDSYNLFASISGGTYLSYDGLGRRMQAVNDSPAINCPNASWSSPADRTNFCPGVTADDTVAHEWAHAYTTFTHGLIYRWQSGALNESYSDIWGEVVDQLNSAGTDGPNALRADNECSTLGGTPLPKLEITAPAEMVGEIAAGGALFNPVPVGISGTVELVNDGNTEGGDGTTTDACQAPVGFTPGNIALVDRGRCGFISKALSVQSAGAAGMILINNLSNDIARLNGSDDNVTIPTVFIGFDNGEALKAALPFDVTINTFESTDPSLRWLSGEDDPSFGGAIRDMWTPECFADAGRVTSTSYKCADSDNGGVHSNSGVPNHAFALLVDGGVYNGQAINGIGLTKASHLYWRAQSVYQVPDSFFPEHADFLELSCQDLLGAALPALSTENPGTGNSAETIGPGDCAELAKVILATELRASTDFCNFEKILDPDPPPICGNGTVDQQLHVDWESGLDGWAVGTRDVVNPATFDTPDWAIVSDLPDERPGSAMFVANLVIGDCQEDIEAGVLFLESPSVVMPPDADNPRLRFEHWVATEPRWDGANVKISVNGAGFTVLPPEAFLFNTYPEDPLLTGNNPMSGEPAFYGTDGGSLGGSWGESQIDLSGFAGPGDNVQLRFELGLDGCNGRLGWYVDTIRVENCTNCTDLWYVDEDGDGFGAGAPVMACNQPVGTIADGSDCDDANADAWSAPGEVTVLLPTGGAATFEWSAPDQSGSGAVVYDVLRTENPANFLAEATCAATGQAGTDYSEIDDPALGVVWAYLVRAVNDCPAGSGSLGSDSNAVPRTGRTCGGRLR